MSPAPHILRAQTRTDEALVEHLERQLLEADALSIAQRCELLARRAHYAGRRDRRLTSLSAAPSLACTSRALGQPGHPGDTPAPGTTSAEPSAAGC